MSHITLDSRCALIIIDLQNGTLGGPLAHPSEDVIDRVNALGAAFHAASLPVVHVRVTGAPAGRTSARLAAASIPEDFAELESTVDRQDDDLILDKQTWGAFSNPDLLDHLRAAGVTQVVLAGVATSIGVESTGRQAHELGFNVTFAVDAMTDPSFTNHEHSIREVFQKVGETATTGQIVTEL